MLPRALLILLLVVYTTKAQQYIDCIPGDLNIIISAPHGGHEEPDHIPDRDAGCYIDGECVYRHDCGEKDFENCETRTFKDEHTQELTYMMREELYDLFGVYPTTVINLLHRKKMDAAGDKDRATYGVEEMEDAWEEYHDCIIEARERIQDDDEYEGMGVYLEIHGHREEIQWDVLGYQISAADLNSGDYHRNMSSIRNLGEYWHGEAGLDFEELIHGSRSLGSFIEDEGLVALPSPTNPEPGENAYWTGSYSTRTYGSMEGGSVDSVLVETAPAHRDNLEVYSDIISRAIFNYVSANYP